MSDCSDCSSDEDADYVPSEELSEEDEDEVKEAKSSTKTFTKNRRKVQKSRKRKGGIRLDDDEDDDDDDEEDEYDEADETKMQDRRPSESKRHESQTVNEEEFSRRAEDLWESFLQDVGPRPQRTAPGGCADGESACSQKPPDAPAKSVPESTKPRSSEKISITKVYDFAGEEVRVTKDVDCDSKEGKAYLRSLKADPQENNDDQNCQTTGTRRAARAGGIGSVLGHIEGKRPRMSTLDRSRLDWDDFKEQEGIEEELATHNRGKEGYIERQAFLDRVDHRIFEEEKNVRLANIKR
uniref:craniofacial development protein 1 isoform X2 n=1 Tax=Myxine glutinosa TaxID=7769 RepID=UPI00358F54C3